MFLHLSFSHSVHGGHAWQGVCIAGGMHGRGACVAGGTCVAGGVCGRVCVWQGACMAGGHVWQGVCMAGGHVWQGGMCGRGHAWQGACMVEDVHGRGCAWQGNMRGRGHALHGAVHGMHAPKQILRYTMIWSMSGRYASYCNSMPLVRLGLTICVVKCSYLLVRHCVSKIMLLFCLGSSCQSLKVREVKCVPRRPHYYVPCSI